MDFAGLFLQFYEAVAQLFKLEVTKIIVEMLPDKYDEFTKVFLF